MAPDKRRRGQVAFRFPSASAAGVQAYEDALVGDLGPDRFGAIRPTG
jgi:hypothetical protein